MLGLQLNWALQLSGEPLRVLLRLCPSCLNLLQISWHQLCRNSSIIYFCCSLWPGKTKYFFLGQHCWRRSPVVLLSFQLCVAPSIGKAGSTWRSSSENSHSLARIVLIWTYHYRRLVCAKIPFSSHLASFWGGRKHLHSGFWRVPLFPAILLFWIGIWSSRSINAVQKSPNTSLKLHRHTINQSINQSTLFKRGKWLSKLVFRHAVW